MTPPIGPLVEVKDLDVRNRTTERPIAPLPVRDGTTEGIGLDFDQGIRGARPSLIRTDARLPFGAL